MSDICYAAGLHVQELSFAPSINQSFNPPLAG